MLTTADEYLTAEQVAERLGVHPKTVRRWARTEADFPVTKIHSVVRHNWRAVERWLETRSSGTSPNQEVARDGKRRGRRPRTDV